MARFGSWNRWFGRGAVIAALALLCTGLVSAASTSNPTTIYACVNNANGDNANGDRNDHGDAQSGKRGNIRIVAAGDTCRKNETLVSWNTQGIQGPPGPAGAVGALGPQGPVGAIGPKGDPGAVGPVGLGGPAGAQGSQGVLGPQGNPGIAGYERVVQTETNVIIPPNGEIIRNVACPAGKRVLGGGIAYGSGTISSGGRPYVEGSVALSDTTWSAALGNPSSTFSATVSPLYTEAICATVLP